MAKKRNNKDNTVKCDCCEDLVIIHHADYDADIAEHICFSCSMDRKTIEEIERRAERREFEYFRREADFLKWSLKRIEDKLATTERRLRHYESVFRHITSDIEREGPNAFAEEDVDRG